MTALNRAVAISDVDGEVAALEALRGTLKACDAVANALWNVTTLHSTWCREVIEAVVEAEKAINTLIARSDDTMPRRPWRGGAT